ncbi:MAG: hypothetical protein AAF772_16845 [Acidobacteriota bacterium]
MLQRHVSSFRIRLRHPALTGAAALLTLLLVACGGKASIEEQAAAANVAAYQALEDAATALAAKRTEITDLRAQLATAPAAGDEAAPSGEGEATTEGDAAAEAPMTAEAIEARIAALGQEVENDAAALSTQIGEFLSTQEMYEGEPLTPEQAGAIRIKSTEDIQVAREYIEKGGDYQRAIDIYSQSLTLDPDNEALQTALAEAEANQYMTEERFAAVEKKMTQDEIRATLGQVNLRNVKEYDDGAVVAWFYRKEDGGAAGVFFNETKKGNGEWQVYDIKFDAVKPPSASGDSA